MHSLNPMENKRRLHPGGVNSGAYRMTDSAGIPFNHGSSIVAGGHLQFAMFFPPPLTLRKAFLIVVWLHAPEAPQCGQARSLVWEIFVFLFSLPFCEIVLGTQPSAIRQYIPYVEATIKGPDSDAKFAAVFALAHRESKILCGYEAKVEQITGTVHCLCV